MKKSWKLMLCAVAAVSVCCAAAEEQGTEANLINVRAALVRTPSAMHGGSREHYGAERFLTALLEQIADREGWSIQYMDRVGFDLDAATESAPYDVVFGAAETAAAREKFRFSKEAILSTWGQVVAKEQIHINTFMDLEDRTVGLVQDDPYNRALRNMIGNLNIRCRFVELSGYQEVVQALQREWIDAGVIDHLHLQDLALPEDVVPTPVLVAPTALRAAVPLEDSSKFLDVIDYQLAEMKQNSGSVYYRLLENFMDKETPADIPPMIGWLLGGAALLALWFGGFTWVLRRKVRLQTRELRDKNHALEDARLRAEAANQAKSAFLAHMSHELRTPLNAVIGLTSLLLRSDMNDEQAEYIKTIQGSGEMLLTVINDILDLSKVEAGEMKLERHIFDLRQCIDSVMDLAAPRAAEKQLELSYHVDADVPANVIGDTVRLRQVLLNLLNNAVKFTESGEVVLSVRSQAVLDAEKCGLRFSIRDTGIGMTSEQVERIFRPFRQADSSTTRQYGGTGLGLTICEKLVQMMDGSFDVESAPGRGSTFSFSIELGAAPPGEEQDESLRKNLPALMDRRVLVVDDNATNRFILEQHLRLWGAMPVPAATGFEALILLESHARFDAVLLDMFMPGMDGLELARNIRERPAFKTLPLVMLTSSMGHDEEFKKSGFEAVLFKPVKPSVLCKTLLRIFSKSAVTPDIPAGDRADRSETRPLRILLAEDNLVNRKVCLLLLTKLGYTAETVVNGEEAVRAVEKSRFDVVLMDVQMPKMDGLAATEEICRRWPEGVRPYIIGVSAHALEEERGRALSTGMNDYLSKPIHIDELRYALLKVPLPFEPDEKPCCMPG